MAFPSIEPDPELIRLRRALARGPGQVYVGRGSTGLAWSAPQHGVLVLGPPRSGKTSALVVPNVLVWPGAVVSTSTKPDVLSATVQARSRVGKCWLLDPTGTVEPPDGVTPLRWSPVGSSRVWDEALVVSRCMVRAARPGSRLGESAHWAERAEALLATLMHASALLGGDMRSVSSWVLRQDPEPAKQVLVARQSSLGADVLAGITATDSREQSGIWSTTAGVLSAYRSERALEAGSRPNFDPTRLAWTRDTVFVCAPGRLQAIVAPIVVAFLEQVRAGAYSAAGSISGNAANRERPGLSPVLLALDELANIAPLPDLPEVVSEGGGQGLITLACLQDLSQARQRWGQAADGFLSLFGTKVVLPAIADTRTLDLVSGLGGDVEVPVRSVSRGPWWSRGAGGTTEGWSTRRQRRLPLDAVNRQSPETALVISGDSGPVRVGLRPWWRTPPFAPVPAAQAWQRGRTASRSISGE